MGLETGTTIAQLNAAWPLGTDPRSQGDDHLRLIKAVVKNDALSKAAGGTVAGATTFSTTITVAAFQINVEAGTFARTTGSIAYKAGTAAGRHQFFLDNVEAARVEPVGTATANAFTLMTREKGDFRYALKTTLLAALAGLGPGVSPLQLRDALIAALNAPPEP